MKVKKKSKPDFKPPNFGVKKRVKDRWRRPRGIDNKKRIRKKSAGPVPKIGYKNSESVRHLHPSGFREVLVHNVDELLKAGKDVVVRIAKSVGRKKRVEIVNKAKELGVRVLNAGDLNG
jgi:large subunit ribosomal protein L32e